MIGQHFGVLVVVGALALTLLGFGAGTKRTSVPSVLGVTTAKAVKQIERRALRPVILERSPGAHKLPDRFRVEDRVVFQNYRGGIVLPVGSAVRVMVYKDRDRHR